MTEEKQFQLLLGHLITNPYSLQAFLAGKKLAICGTISSSVISEAFEYFSNEKRVSFVARRLDERLLRNVSRFLSLTAYIADSNSFGACWKAFRAMNPEIRFDRIRTCASQFSVFALNYGLSPTVHPMPYLNDVLRYENALLSVKENTLVTDSRDREKIHQLDVDLHAQLDLSQLGYPVTKTSCLIENFTFPITEILENLRSASSASLSPPTRDFSMDDRQAERLLFFVSWKDGVARAIRLSSSVESIVALCTGRYHATQLASEAGYNPGSPMASRIPALLRSLEQIGLLRLFPYCPLQITN